MCCLQVPIPSSLKLFYPNWRPYISKRRPPRQLPLEHQRCTANMICRSASDAQIIVSHFPCGDTTLSPCVSKGLYAPLRRRRRPLREYRKAPRRSRSRFRPRRKALEPSSPSGLVPHKLSQGQYLPSPLIFSPFDV